MDRRPATEDRMTAPDEAAREAKRARLYERYNNTALDSGQRIQGEFFLRLVEEYDELDEEWTEGWLTWIYDLQYNRGILDEKTRILPIVGYCVILDDQGQLPNHMRAALRAGATPREILEIILQSAIYAGMPRMVRAMRTYRTFMREMGLLELSEPVFRGDAREP
jgi:alkylhydroperoxidase/carboxymuconolactone decarboxylase family protein YurZ